jgi:hypothetical protein
MKRFNFLSVVIAMVLLVTAVSCTTMTGTQDDYYNGDQARVYGNRIYVEDPYRGTIVLERDPWSGRYYEVSPYGTYYGNRYYGRYDTYRRNNGYYNRGNNNYQRQPQQPTEEQRRRNEEQKNEARKKVLGN